MTGLTCVHCGHGIRPGEAAVRPWIHDVGFYQCPGRWGQGLFAEPEGPPRKPSRMFSQTGEDSEAPEVAG